MWHDSTIESDGQAILDAIIRKRPGMSEYRKHAVRARIAFWLDLVPEQLILG